MQIDLRGRTVLVTGGSRGIGAAICRSMAAAGARVAVHFHRRATEARSIAEEIGGGAKAFGADLADAAAAGELFRNVVEEFEHVDVLVNNAGVAHYAALGDDFEDWLGRWESTMNINLRAAAILCREAVNHFSKPEGGRIINIASRAAFRGDTPEYMAYAASKGGLVALSRSLARGLGRENIKVFVVAPGFTETDMTREFTDRYGEDFAKGDIALDRLTRPEDISPFVVFLASGLADHATGATIDINAGSYVH